MKHKWKTAEVGNTYSEYQCTKCKRKVVINMEDDDWHEKLTDCPGKPKPIVIRPLATTPEEEAERLYPGAVNIGRRSAFIHGVTWQRRQYGDQRREVERLQNIIALKKELEKLK